MRYALPSVLKGCFNDIEVNLGDCIQTIASQRLLRKHLNYKDEFVYLERDHGELKTCKGLRGLNVVTNGWYFQEAEWSFTNSDNKFTITGLHIHRTSRSDPSHLNGKFKDRNVEIGCRDIATYRYLRENGFKNAYFSGCMSLTLEKRVKVLGDNVYLVDVSKNEVSNFKFGKRKVIEYNNCIRINGRTWDEMMKIAEDRYNEIRDYASLVITRRLHVYMPCLAMGIPVIYAGPMERRTEIVNRVVESNIDKVKQLVTKCFLNAVVGVDDINLKNELINTVYGVNLE